MVVQVCRVLEDLYAQYTAKGASESCSCTIAGFPWLEEIVGSLSTFYDLCCNLGYELGVQCTLELFDNIHTVY